jgi:type I restriction enzyme S subunit
MKFATGYLGYFMNSNAYHDQLLPLMQGTKVNSISKSAIVNTHIKYPKDIKEQEKIGQYFIELDNLINLHQRKTENLKLFKRGVTQKLFPSRDERIPKLRIGGFSNDWKLAKIGDLLAERNKKSPKSDEYPLMSFVAYEGVKPKGERFNREFLVNDENGKKYKKTEFGDFIYSSNNLTTGSIGLNRYGKATISPVYSIFSPTEMTTPDFISSLLVRPYFIGQMIRYRQGVVYGQWRIHESDFLKMSIRIPELDEQQEIQKLLKYLDKKINTSEKQLENLKQFKKGLLQQMFV